MIPREAPHPEAWTARVQRAGALAPVRAQRLARARCGRG